MRCPGVVPQCDRARLARRVDGELLVAKACQAGNGERPARPHRAADRLAVPFHAVVAPSELCREASARRLEGGPLDDRVTGRDVDEILHAGAKILAVVLEVRLDAEL